MKILIIGGTGHVGSFMVPKLVKAGHEVYLGTRGNTKVRSYSSTEGVNFVTVNSGDRESLETLCPIILTRLLICPVLLTTAGAFFLKR